MRIYTDEGNVPSSLHSLAVFYLTFHPVTTNARLRRHPNLDECLPGTRVDVLTTLLEWARDTTASRIFHLIGGAGTGKTTTAATFVRLLHRHGLLGGSFFHYRADDQYNDVYDMFPMISDSLASVSPAFRSARASSKKTPFLHLLEDQFSMLVDQPAQSSLYRDTASTLIVVIDAFDESGQYISTLLDIIAKPGPSHPIKYLVPSRLHKDTKAISDTNFPSGMRTLNLQDVDYTSVHNDILLYLRQKLTEIGDKCDLHRDGELWPPASQLSMLARQAGRFWIYAATAVRYISSRDPRARLQRLISTLR